MKNFIIGFFVFLPLFALGKSDFYSFKVKNADLSDQSLDKFKNKTVLVVNVASRCGYTSQYDGLELIYKKYQNQDFVILGFPSNQFMGQEPGTNEEIQKFCKLKYGVTFPIFAKVDVKGEQAIPLFKWLIAQKKSNKEISWNFNKFLINNKGELVKHFSSGDKPSEIDPEIKKLIDLK